MFVPARAVHHHYIIGINLMIALSKQSGRPGVFKNMIIMIFILNPSYILRLPLMQAMELEQASPAPTPAPVGVSRLNPT